MARNLDFSETNVLSHEDIEMLIKCFIGEERTLSDSDMQLLIVKVFCSFYLFIGRIRTFTFAFAKIFEEADIDENGEISLDEFEYVVSKSPEFAK